MKQFSYEIHDSSELAGRLADVRRYLDGTQHTAVLAHVFSGFTDRARLAPVLDALAGALPEASIVGTTAAGEICEGLVTRPSVVVAVSVFETTEVVVRTYQVEAGAEREVGAAVREAIDATSDVQAVELLVDGGRVSSEVLFPEINKCAPQVQIFGAMPYAHDIKEPMYLFTSQIAATADEGVELVVITYAGRDFHVETDHAIGWKPMGAGMLVTRAEGSILHELDGRSALAVYDKYLQIPNDEHFYDNAFEFPFLRYVNDTYLMRHPYAGLPDGSIELGAPVEEGDTVYLSYGDIPTIVTEILEARGRMERFHPQCIRLHDCAARKAFWGPEIDRETEPFQRLAPTSGFCTGGEILRVNGELVHFNTTLVIIGMREGEPDARDLLRTANANLQEEVNTQQTSMVRRMAHFINVAMQELIDSNERLDALAKTDELTALLNRREMNHIIAQCHEEGRPFCLIMADLDDFKAVNDTYGHDVGDSVLQDVAALIRSCIDDVEGASAGRWGGEEFMVFLPDTGLEGARAVAERLRAACEALRFDVVQQLTISLGVADSATYEDMKSIYQDVDRALYAAKAAGKNEVVLVSSLEAE